MNEHDQDFDEAVILQWEWKTPRMRAMTLDACRLALMRGSQTFSALDLPKRGADEQGGTGIAGSVFKRLADNGIIARVGKFFEDKFYPESIINDGGNPIGVYRLAHGGKARALVRIHGGPVRELKQAALFEQPVGYGA